MGLRLPAAIPTSATATISTADDAPSVFDVTIIVPTRNEAGNVAELLRRLDVSLGGIAAEILFVDDSDDATPQIVMEQAQLSSRVVRLVHRRPGERDGRLGGAVVTGFQLASAPWALVLDGDLQHPPEAIPALMAATSAEHVDLVYGTRYGGSGDSSGLDGRSRALVSKSSTKLAKAVFPGKLRGVSDPMSGFFAVRLAALDLATLRPPGYKVLLEILAVSRLRNTTGVPFAFQPRFSGDSKASFAEGIRYLKQLLALRLGTSVAQLTQLTAFLAVGGSGVAVNTAVLWALSDRWWHQPYLLASLLATNVAIAWNFGLLELFVFRKNRKHSAWKGFLRFWWLNIALLPLQLGLLALLVEVLSQSPVVGNVVALSIVFVVRYLATTMWVYERKTTGTSATAAAFETTPLLTAEPIAVAAEARANKTSPARQWRRPPAVQVFVRLGSALAATMVAFPAVAVHLWQLLRTGGPSAGILAVALVAGVALVLVRASPAPGDPDVHDRQLDFILAVPALLGALFLSFAWPVRLDASGPLGTREVLAFTVFLAAATLLLLGTRCTARLRRLLYLPLLMLPVVRNEPLLAGALVLLFAVMVAMTFARQSTPSGASGRWPIRRTAPAAGRAGGPVPVGGPAAIRMSTKLPKWQPAVIAVMAAAAILGFVALAAPSHPAPAPMPSAGSR